MTPSKPGMRGAVLFEIAVLVGLGAASRLFPHLPNMTAIGAVALRARSRFGIPGLGIPIISMLASDLFIGFYNWRLLLTVYASFALIGMLGALIPQNTSIRRIGAVSVLGSTLFFLITNTAVWALSAWYPHTAQGLLMCYVAGLPFFYPMLAGDIVFSCMLFRLSARVSMPRWTQNEELALMRSHF
ncbi:hypothetical protein A3A38_00660 [Candidatus Kaiserbacteria bacterium RIFCSPLOWO2_01_FULL_53_17]|uniref:Rod shape-determining protein MreD n=1 Tax=Candidatus Kaiserbacteria bacterium RIFCSPLOWO2_01_FULL_53_17 TaxID=1798511 RepID=A0A1F6EGP7_9BACT|nr:MAG: hypothetical protein A3A38_00660 [Candidatus Kaiserbacteria bacterium RIFCSPLOWO2_01_FULL_53_17]